MTTLPEKTYFEVHAEELLKQAGLNKARFAEQMGVARQNVQKIFGTKNVFTLLKAVEILGVPLNTLIGGEKTNSPAAIIGFVEINGEIYKIKDKKDIEDLMSKV
ncbi:MAG: helix-turn-helix transcriptional regulator [Bacteroidetes bacterium]|uniref:Helix-turn-helix transcriptional regulator n=1 Tax=Candidatus Cryptobacteroides merdavium TaxID=2840769 RepID=A0A9D9H7Q0_9BACT|nr:helix-turn-helix transcriptional regulator [Candidatus Cryptobacteroides merdavium]